MYLICNRLSMAAEIQAPMFPVASCDFVKDLGHPAFKILLIEVQKARQN